MNQKICYAIENKYILEFSYNGHHCVVEPHAYGLSQRLKKVLLCYQIGGTSDSGIVPGWKLINVVRISSLTVIYKHFLGEREGYRGVHMSLSTIFCEL